MVGNCFGNSIIAATASVDNALTLCVPLTTFRAAWHLRLAYNTSAQVADVSIACMCVCVCVCVNTCVQNNLPTPRDITHSMEHHVMRTSFTRTRACDMCVCVGEGVVCENDRGRPCFEMRQTM